jgi:PKD repeat protein
MARLCGGALLLALVTLIGAEGARYLIVTPDVYYDEVLPLAEWKTRKGMLAYVAKLSEIGSNYTQIKSFIQTAYNTWDPRPEYVLIMGDAGSVSMPYHSSVRSDCYYVDLTGDYHTELMVGRISVSTESEAEVAIAKTLSYQRTPYMDQTSWYTKGTRIGGDQYYGYGSYDEDSPIYWAALNYGASYMYANGYTQVDSFSDWLGDNQTEVYNAVNDGRSIVAFRGQAVCDWGSYSAFDVNPYSTNNGWKLPFVISPTCRMISTTGGSSCGEEWLKAGTASNPKGGIGFTGTTYSGGGYPFPEARSAMMEGTFDGLFQFDSCGTIGYAVELGRQAVLDSLPTHPERWDHYSGYLCIGDPELTLWTAVPTPMVVSHPDYIPMGFSSVSVTVTSGGSSLANALVCLYKDSDVYETDSTDASGTCSIDVHSGSGGMMNVTVTKRNYIPYEDSIQVQDTIPPVADFSGDPLEGGEPLSVQFMDLSSGMIDTWIWDFGDGDSAYVRNPHHVYESSGFYDVKLWVSSSLGSDEETKSEYVHVIAPMDTAWLSSDVSGDPILEEYEAWLDEEATVHFMLTNGSDTAHSVMFPVCYDTSHFELQSLRMDSAAFPMPATWNFFENDTIHNGTGKVMLFAWTSVYAFGIPPGRNHVGTGMFTARDTGSFVMDTCLYPPVNHLNYANGPTATDYWPRWYPVDVTVEEGICGDANGDGALTTGDGFLVLNYFGAGPAPVSCFAANVNGDGTLTTGDGFHLLNFFGGGPDLDCAPCDLN